MLQLKEESKTWPEWKKRDLRERLAEREPPKPERRATSRPYK
jgi:hypothetical protein